MVVCKSHSDTTGSEHMKKKWRQAEIWQCVAGLESLKNTQRGNCKGSGSEDLSILKKPVPCYDHSGTTAAVKWSRPEPMR